MALPALQQPRWQGFVRYPTPASRRHPIRGNAAGCGEPPPRVDGNLLVVQGRNLSALPNAQVRGRRSYYAAEPAQLARCPQCAQPGGEGPTLYAAVHREIQCEASDREPLLSRILRAFGKAPCGQFGGCPQEMESWGCVPVSGASPEVPSL